MCACTCTHACTCRGDKALEEVPDFKAPKTMGMGKWFSYLGNVASLSPIPKDMKLGAMYEKWQKKHGKSIGGEAK